MYSDEESIEWVEGMIYISLSSTPRALDRELEDDLVRMPAT